MDDDDELVGLMSAQPVALDAMDGDDDDDLGWLQTAPSQTQLRSPYAPDEAAGGDEDAEAAHLERLAQEGEDADAEAALAEAEGHGRAPGAAKTTRVSLDAFASRACQRHGACVLAHALTRPPRARQRPRSAREARRRRMRPRRPAARRRRMTRRGSATTLPLPTPRRRRRPHPSAACARRRSTTAWTWMATAFRVRTQPRRPVSPLRGRLERVPAAFRALR